MSQTISSPQLTQPSSINDLSKAPDRCLSFPLFVGTQMTIYHESPSRDRPTHFTAGIVFDVSVTQTDR